MLISLLVSFQIQRLKTKEDIQQFLKQNNHALIKFYSDTCSYSLRLQPRYIDLEDLPHIAALGQISCQDDVALCDEFNINRVPALMLFQKGKSIATFENVMKGPVTPKEIHQWVHDKIHNVQPPKSSVQKNHTEHFQQPVQNGTEQQ